MPRLTIAGVEQRRRPFAPSERRNESWYVRMLQELLRIVDGGDCSSRVTWLTAP